MYGGKFCISKLIGLAHSWKEIYLFCFVLLCIWGQFPSTSPGVLIFRGVIKQRDFCVMSLGGLYEGLIHGGAYFRNSTVNEIKFLKVQYSRSSPCDHSCKWPALVTTTFVKPHLNCDSNCVMKALLSDRSCKGPRPLLELHNWTFPLFLSSCKCMTTQSLIHKLPC